MYMAKACVDLKTAWQWEAKSQWKREVATGPVTMHITLFHGDKRNRDIDNFSKIIFDCLTGIVYEDDSQVNQLSIVKSYDKGNPRVELEILCA